jgi:hypothetical protein
MRTDGQTERRAGMMKLPVGFHNFANVRVKTKSYSDQPAAAIK